MKELCLQQVADLFGCYACINKYEEDKILLYDRHPYYNKDSGTYGGRCVGWVENAQEDTTPRVVTPMVSRRPSVSNVVRGLDVTLVIGPEQTVLYNAEGLVCGEVGTRHLLFGIGLQQVDGGIVCHSQYDVAI